MLDILAAVIERPILQAIRTSQAVGLELDESTDVSVLRQLDIHVRYLDQEGKLCCHFLALVPIQDGKADSIVGAVREVVEKKEIPPHLICGLGTDGAAVMTGRINGVAKQLSEIWPGLLCTHCAAHRLALACKDAADKVPYMKTFKEHLQQLHLYFRNSANRSAALSAAAAVLGITDLKVKEVKDTRWLSQHLAIQNLQKNISAVLNVLAEEVEVRKCAAAKGLYSFLATYRFIAALHLQADVLPHLSRLSKIFQKEDLNFLAIKEQVPVTLAIIGHIKDAGDQQAPGSHLSRLNQSLDDPAGLGQFSISVEQERGRRGQPEGGDREHFWRRFRSEVMDPYLNGLIRGLEERFPNLEVFGSFSALGPQAATSPDHEAAHGHLRTLAEHFPSVDASIAVEEWMSFREHVVSGALKDKTQLGIMNDLTSKYEEFGVLYPNLCKLAAIALTVPLSSVNCERDFSTMNRVKTDLRNRLQGEHLEACMRISISGPSVQEFPYEEALKIFFRKPRKIKCSDNSCTMGNTEDLVSDNGPQFASSEFADFATEWAFQHTTSSPHYPRSNGLAESSVKIVKGLMKKAQDGKADFHQSLMIYQRAHKVKVAKIKEKKKQKQQHDKRAKHLRDLKPGEHVRIRDHVTGIWNIQGSVEREVAPRSYQIQTEQGASLRRNQVDLKPQVSSQQCVEQPDGASQVGETTSNLAHQIAQNEPANPDVPSVNDSVKTPLKTLGRPRRNVQPPSRLIESCWTLEAVNGLK
ncbi:Zinc finger protein 862 [Merluccius polli]|uniref:Zinc finger protein 862 n=1 Tax=Merluccius polli TaxID=89951 RepID=A0AA47NTE0_MERPO|nr:Zinc finger protein 862 [Merluccius polli]